MKYIRTKDGIYKIDYSERGNYYSKIKGTSITIIFNKGHIIESGDTIEELCDDFVFLENGHINNVVYLPEAKDRLLEYHEMGNYEPRLIGRIKVGLNKKAVAEWKELTEGKYKGCYDWVLL